MTFFKTSALILGLAALGIGCGDSGGGNQPDAPIIGGGAGGVKGTGGAQGTGGALGTGGAVGTGGVKGAGGAPGTGGAVGIDAGSTGGAVGLDGGHVVIDAPAVDGAGGSSGTGDSGAIDGGGGPTKEGHLAIINATTTSVGLTVVGPTPVPYTSCK